MLFESEIIFRPLNLGLPGAFVLYVWVAEMLSKCNAYLTENLFHEYRQGYL